MNGWLSTLGFCVFEDGCEWCDLARAKVFDRRASIALCVAAVAGVAYAVTHRLPG